jgi:hypothetical protein
MAICFIIEVIQKKLVEGADVEHISLVEFTLNLSYNWNRNSGFLQELFKECQNESQSSKLDISFPMDPLEYLPV